MESPKLRMKVPTSGVQATTVLFHREVFHILSATQAERRRYCNRWACLDSPQVDYLLSENTVKVVKIAGPDHPISIDVESGRVIITMGGRVIADSRRALALREANYPVVHYIPREDIDMSALIGSELTSYCPYKGDATYFKPSSGDESAREIAWSYEHPHDGVASIAGRLAFYRDCVEGYTCSL